MRNRDNSSIERNEFSGQEEDSFVFEPSNVSPELIQEVIELAPEQIKEEKREILQAYKEEAAKLVEPTPSEPVYYPPPPPIEILNTVQSVVNPVTNVPVEVLLIPQKTEPAIPKEVEPVLKTLENPDPAPIKLVEDILNGVAKIKMELRKIEVPKGSFNPYQSSADESSSPFLGIGLLLLLLFIFKR